MAQPYDLTGLAEALITVGQMIADQRAGRVKFAGGSETWLANPTGTFMAFLAVGGALVPTTTNAVRAALTTLRVTFDLIAAAAGTSAENAVTTTSAAVPAAALESGTKGAIGPVVFVGTAQGTSYDLSGIAAAQAAANAMLADAQAGVTNFAGGTFQAFLGENVELREDGSIELREDASFELIENAGAQAITMAPVRAVMTQLRAAFDLLAQ